MGMCEERLIQAMAESLNIDRSLISVSISEHNDQTTITWMIHGKHAVDRADLAERIQAIESDSSTHQYF